MFKRAKNDNRRVDEVVRDVSHDLYHRAAKLDKGNRDGRLKYDQCATNDCEWRRVND